MSETGAGKGDKRRPTNEEKYRDHFESIFNRVNNCKCGFTAKVKYNEKHSPSYSVHCVREDCDNYMGYYENRFDAIDSWNRSH